VSIVRKGAAALAALFLAGPALALDGAAVE
jgi:hypothetical protein